MAVVATKPSVFSPELKAAITADFAALAASRATITNAQQITKLQAQLAAIPAGSFGTSAQQRIALMQQIALLKTQPASAIYVPQTVGAFTSFMTASLIPTWYRGTFVDVSQGATPQYGYLKYRVLVRNGVSIWEVPKYFKLNEGDQTITDVMAAQANGWHVVIGSYYKYYTTETNAWQNTIQQVHNVVPAVDSYFFLGDPHPYLAVGQVGAGYVPGVSGKSITMGVVKGVAGVVLPVLGGVIAAPLIFAGVGTAGASAAGAVAGEAVTGSALGTGAAAGEVASATTATAIGTNAGAVALTSTTAIGATAASAATPIASNTVVAAGSGVSEVGISPATPLSNPPPVPNVGGTIGETAAQATGQAPISAGETAAISSQVPAVGGAAGTGAGSGSLLSNLSTQIGAVPASLAKSVLGTLLSKELGKLLMSNQPQHVAAPVQRAGFGSFFTDESGTFNKAWLLLIPLLLLIILFFTGRRLQG